MPFAVCYSRLAIAQRGGERNLVFAAERVAASEKDIVLPVISMLDLHPGSGAGMPHQHRPWLLSRVGEAQRAAIESLQLGIQVALNILRQPILRRLTIGLPIQQPQLADGGIGVFGASFNHRDAQLYLGNGLVAWVDQQQPFGGVERAIGLSGDEVVGLIDKSGVA